jgi:phosphodiesterase/alkaline phosphatase D-like protein
MKILLLFVFLMSCSTPHKISRDSAFNWDRTFIPIMQGVTDSTNTTINFIVPKSFEYQVKVNEVQNNTQVAFKIKELTLKKSSWNVVQLDFMNLSVQKSYELIVTISKGAYHYSDKRIFKTLDLKKKKLNISISSCLADTHIDIADKAWPSIEKKNVDAYFFIGDVVYADFVNGRYTGEPVSNVEQVWSRYIDSRNQVTFYRLKHLRPVYAVWDDHDLGFNNADKSYRWMGKVKSIFLKFFPQGNKITSISRGPGVSYSLDLAHHRFYFLDNRSFRDSNKKPYGYHLGKKQQQWLYKSLQNSTKRNWLILGDQFFGGYHKFESFEGKHPKKFREFMSKLKSLNKKYVFISGDRHLYELMKISSDIVGHTTYEITTSGVHAKIFPGTAKKISNSRRLNVIDSEYSSLLLHLDGKASHYEAINHNGKVLDSFKIDLEGSRP